MNDNKEGKKIIWDEFSCREDTNKIISLSADGTLTVYVNNNIKKVIIENVDNT